MVTPVTIGICAYNEDKNIEHLLESLSEQGLPSNYEVLIVCSGCTDKTVEICQAYAKNDPRIKIFIEPKRTGKATAVNQILENAQGSTIIFVSADTVPHYNCFSNLVAHLNGASNIGVTCGRPVPVKEAKLQVNKIVQLLWQFHDHVFKELNDSGIARHASEVFALRKEAAEKMPLETVNDDAYLAVSAKMKGWSVKYEPKAAVSISGPRTFSEYFLQRRRIIFGHYQTKKMLGMQPQYLVHLFPLYPRKTMSLVAWLFSQSGVLNFLLFITIELILNVLAIVDIVLGNSHSSWVVCPSTKTVNR